MKTANSLFFKVELAGQGVVNYNGKESKEDVKKYGGSNANTSHDNASYAKSAYKKTDIDENDEPKYDRTLKISRECILKALFKRDSIASNGRVNYNDALLANFISSPEGLLRGYMFVNKFDSQSAIKSKSGLTVCDALEDSGAVITMDIGTQSGNNDNNKTSLFYKENVGKTHYTIEGSIDPMELEFISCDDFFGRRAISNRWIEGNYPILDACFMGNYERIPYTKGHFTLANNSQSKHIAEYGLHLDKEFVKEIIRMFFSRLFDLHIRRRGSYARVCKIYVKPVYNGMTDTKENPDGYISVNSMDEFNDFLKNIEFQEYYVEGDNDAEEVMNDLMKKEKEDKERMKREKEEERRLKEESKKKNKKNSKNKKTEETEEGEEE